MSSTMEGFGENVAPIAAIRAILDSYPFSVGLLRELLQNSDDARASKQVRYGIHASRCETLIEFMLNRRLCWIVEPMELEPSFTPN